jgi:hypothetical protein
MPTICASSSLGALRVLLVEDEPYLADAISDGLRLEAIAADIAGDGDTGGRPVFCVRHGQVAEPGARQDTIST